MTFWFCLRSDFARINDKNSLSSIRLLFSRKFCAVLFIRFSLLSIPVFSSFFKALLLICFNIEVSRFLKIGPGLLLPHPRDIILGCVSIGSNVTIMHGVTLGSHKIDLGFDSGTRPKIGNDCFLGINCVVLGGGHIANNSLILPNSFVNLKKNV